MRRTASGTCCVCQMPIDVAGGETVMAVLWLTVLVPILAAAVLKRAPLPGIGIAAAAMTAIAAGVGAFAWSALDCSQGGA